MTPTFHPRLVNGRFGDPALFVERLHQREALLFDMGDLAALPARDLLRVSHVFVSHAHIDHFIGFDALLRVLVGREKIVRMWGPPGFCVQVHHKLQAYAWDLVDRYDTDLVFAVEDYDGAVAKRASFSFKRRFAFEEAGERVAADGLLTDEPDLLVRAALLDHHGPCLGFVAAEPAHVNVWRNRLEARGLEPGAWLQSLKRAVVAGADDDLPIALPDGTTVPLGQLRDVVSVTPGQRLGYVTDVADTPANRAAILALATGADLLFIESRFAAADRPRADARAHLTTSAAGEIARAAGVRRVEPFHFSPRYEDEEERMLAEVAAAFASNPPAHKRDHNSG